jgi:DNA polymerase
MLPEQWQCTAALARELGLPGNLEAVGEVIGLPEEKQKLKTGRALIRYFSIPCRPTKTNGQRKRNLPAHDPEKWTLYVDYNRQDVEAEREIHGEN